MNKLIGLLQLRFLPRSPDIALLILRVWIGLSMLYLHGWGKLSNFSRMAGSFADPLGIGSKASLGLAVFGEVVCSLLLIFGLFSRLAALGGMVTMSVAFFLVHKSSLARGPSSGELAFIYLAAFVALFVAGPGRFSVDERMGGKGSRPKEKPDRKNDR
jgi:putative oxidoreductase